MLCGHACAYMQFIRNTHSEMQQYKVVNTAEHLTRQQLCDTLMPTVQKHYRQTDRQVKRTDNIKSSSEWDSAIMPIWHAVDLVLCEKQKQRGYTWNLLPCFCPRTFKRLWLCSWLVTKFTRTLLLRQIQHLMWWQSIVRNVGTHIIIGHREKSSHPTLWETKNRVLYQCLYMIEIIYISSQVFWKVTSCRLLSSYQSSVFIFRVKQPKKRWCSWTTRPW